MYIEVKNFHESSKMLYIQHRIKIFKKITLYNKNIIILSNFVTFSEGFGFQSELDNKYE